jgi:hypothetical protein
MILVLFIFLLCVSLNYVVAAALTIEQIEQAAERGAKRARTENDISKMQPSYLLTTAECGLAVGLDAVPREGGTSVLSIEVLENIVLAAMTDGRIDEHKLIVYFTPILDDILQTVNPDSSCMIVNSEEYKWLKQHDLAPSHDLKPDLCVVYQNMYMEKPESNPQSLRDFRAAYRAGVRDYEFIFGVPLFQFSDSIKLVIEWKGNITPLDRATIYSYLLHLARDSPLIIFRGLLCDSNGFFAVECCGGNIRFVQYYCWTVPGSLDKLRELFAIDTSVSPWITLLRKSCDQLNVRLASAPVFLGGGGFGRVFKVYDNDGSVRALKIILSTKFEYSPNQIASASLTEFNTLCTGFPVEAQFLVHAIKDTFFSFEHMVGGILTKLGHAYLLRECGLPLDVTSEIDVGGAFGALSGIHGLGRYHGDARIDNAISVVLEAGVRAVKWVDFMQHGMDATRADIECDLAKLVGSIKRRPFSEVITRAMLDSYHQNPLNKWEPIFRAVWTL